MRNAFITAFAERAGLIDDGPVINMITKGSSGKPKPKINHTW